MSGEPTDAQLLTCKAVEADASTFPHAVANRIDVSYGNYIYIFFLCSFFKDKRPGHLLLFHVQWWSLARTVVWSLVLV